MAEAQWAEEEWRKMRAKLERLSLAELCDLTTRVGITFTIGNDKITDRDEFILVLDEADRPELEIAYRDVLASRTKRARRRNNETLERKNRAA